MQETINMFLGLNDFHWRGSAYQWFFYAGILLTLLLEKRRMQRIVFGWLPLLYLVFMFNPLCIRLLNMSGLHNQAYFTRLFSFMPLVYVIARGFTMILRIDNGWLKMVGVGLACVVVCIAGKNIYLEDWLVKAENYEKVPRETFEILNAIDAGDNQNVSIAPIDATAVYIRQVANVVTPYGRVPNNLGRLLSTDQPDVSLIMQTAGQQDVDYVMVHRTGITLASFLKYRYRPFAMTRNYAIYRVEGVPRARRIFNEKRQVASVIYYDAAGRPEDDTTGFYSIAYGYDSRGNQIRESHLDQSGKPTRLGVKYASAEKNYYLSGYVSSIDYLDENDNMVLIDGRYITSNKYNSIGRLICEKYYDEVGKPMKKLGDLYAIRKLTYASDDIIKSEMYYDEEDNPIRSTGGYAGFSREYDEKMKLISESYFDTDGSLLGSVSAESSSEAVLMNRFLQFTEGAKKEGNTVTLETQFSNNPLNGFCFKLHDAVTGEFLLSFGIGNTTGQFSGEYVHELPSGIYRLVFKGNTKLQDETISCLEYISEGERLYYSYYVDGILGNSSRIRDFFIGRVVAEAE